MCIHPATKINKQISPIEFFVVAVVKYDWDPDTTPFNMPGALGYYGMSTGRGVTQSTQRLFLVVVFLGK